MPLALAKIVSSQNFQESTQTQQLKSTNQYCRNLQIITAIVTAAINQVTHVTTRQLTQRLAAVHSSRVHLSLHETCTASAACFTLAHLSCPHSCVSPAMSRSDQSPQARIHRRLPGAYCPCGRCPFSPPSAASPSSSPSSNRLGSFASSSSSESGAGMSSRLS